MDNLFKTIEQSADTLNALGIYLHEIRIPNSLKDEIQTELLENPTSLEDLDIEDGQTTINKITYGKNTIKIIWYEK